MIGQAFLDRSSILCRLCEWSCRRDHRSQHGVELCGVTSITWRCVGAFVRARAFPLARRARSCRALRGSIHACHLPVPSLLRTRYTMRSVILQVRRRCLVCDSISTFEEPAATFEIGTPCPVCNAPTERTEILGRRSIDMRRNPHAAALGRLGGLKGGPARAAALSPERRHDIAVRAAHARWSLRGSLIPTEFE